MNKPRPPQHADFTKAENNIQNLNKLTYLMTRQYLGREPNNYPRYFYKYLSSEIKEEYLRCLLIDSDFYLASCKNFNDPFDTTANVVRLGSLQQLRKRFGQIIDNNKPGISKKSKEHEISLMMSNYSKDTDAYKKILTKNTQQAGIFSVTKNSRNILMWSHYANQHKGILLQFEIAKSVDSLLYALKMHYSEEYPSFDIGVSPDNQFENIMMRKSKDWEYENEWRILRIGGAETYQSFKPEALTSLIFGCRSEVDFRNNVINILKERESIGHPKVNILKAEMHKSKYALKYFKLS